MVNFRPILTFNLCRTTFSFKDLSKQVLISTKHHLQFLMKNVFINLILNLFLIVTIHRLASLKPMTVFVPKFLFSSLMLDQP